MKIQQVNIILGSSVLVISGVLFLTTFTFEGGSISQIFPQTILIMMMILSATMILRGVRKGAKSKEKPPGELMPMPVLLFMGASVIYCSLIFKLGFFLTTSAFVILVPFASSRLIKSESNEAWQKALLKYLLLALGVALFIYLSFNIILHFSFPRGLAF